MAGILVNSAIKKMVKDGEKKCGADFLQTVNDIVEAKIKACISDHNGGRKILDAGVAKLVFGVK